MNGRSLRFLLKILIACGLLAFQSKAMENKKLEYPSGDYLPYFVKSTRKSPQKITQCKDWELQKYRTGLIDFQKSLLSSLVIISRNEEAVSEKEKYIKLWSNAFVTKEVRPIKYDVYETLDEMVFFVRYNKIKDKVSDPMQYKGKLVSGMDEITQEKIDRLTKADYDFLSRCSKDTNQKISYAAKAFLFDITTNQQLCFSDTCIDKREEAKRQNRNFMFALAEKLTKEGHVFFRNSVAGLNDPMERAFVRFNDFSNARGSEDGDIDQNAVKQHVDQLDQNDEQALGLKEKMGLIWAGSSWEKKEKVDQLMQLKADFLVASDHFKNFVTSTLASCTKERKLLEELLKNRNSQKQEELKKRCTHKNDARCDLHERKADSDLSWADSKKKHSQKPKEKPQEKKQEKRLDRMVVKEAMAKVEKEQRSAPFVQWDSRVLRWMVDPQKVVATDHDYCNLSFSEKNWEIVCHTCSKTLVRYIRELGIEQPWGDDAISYNLPGEIVYHGKTYLGTFQVGVTKEDGRCFHWYFATKKNYADLMKVSQYNDLAKYILERRFNSDYPVLSQPSKKTLSENGLLVDHKEATDDVISENEFVVEIKQKNGVIVRLCKELNR